MENLIGAVVIGLVVVGLAWVCEKTWTEMYQDDLEE